MIKIDIIPFVLTDKEKSSWTWKMKKKLAIQDLEVARISLQKDLEDNLPVAFHEDIVLNVSVNKKTMKVEIDYSATKSKKAIRLIKLYLAGDMDTFAKEWLELIINYYA